MVRELYHRVHLKRKQVIAGDSVVSRFDVSNLQKLFAD